MSHLVPTVPPSQSLSAWIISLQVHSRTTQRLTRALLLALGCITLPAVALPSIATAQNNAAPAKPAPMRTQARLMWHDQETHQPKWGDLGKGESWGLNAQTVQGWPSLADHQASIAQLAHHQTNVVAAIRDDQEGKQWSGWVAIDHGVRDEAHGDHFHSKYTDLPKVRKSKLDASQGNPAHIYVYDQQFFLANDTKNGLTVLAPNPANTSDLVDRFVEAGGGHITLAAIANQVAYATWIDAEGDNAGRVDVVSLANSPLPKRYQFRLPSGGLHGATTNNRKVFFAPSDGICWVDADASVSKDPNTIKPQYISLGTDAEGKPLRTGAFANLGTNVLGVTGKGKLACLFHLNAASSKPVVRKLSLPIQDNQSLTTPKTLTLGSGKSYAALFVETREEAGKDELLLIDMDPNGDKDLGDAKITARIPVGKHKIEGHAGHHDVAFVPGKRLILVTNPGDGTIQVISLNEGKTVATLMVGGVPTHLTAMGGM